MTTDPRWMAAFDVGGTLTKLALVSTRGEVRAWSSFPTEAPRGAYLSRLTHALYELASQSTAPLFGVAGSVAGFLSEEGSVLYNPNLPWLEDTDIRAHLRDSFDLPIQLETDANAACAGEFLFGTGQRSRRFLCVTGGTGLGAGMIVDGRLLCLAFGGLGDAGHVIVVPNGPSCSCGGHGCAEALLSSAALTAQFSEATRTPQSFRSLARHVAAADPHALAVAQQAGHHLGVALASLAHIFFPDRIAIAGGLSALGQPLLRAAQTAFTAHAGTLPASLATIHLADTGAYAGLQGAAASMSLAHPSPFESPLSAQTS